MCVNGKMIYVATIPGMVAGGYRRVMEVVNSSIICLTYCINICKCHKVLPPSSTIKKRKKKNNILT
jgi:hypothetical protein